MEASRQRGDSVESCLAPPKPPADKHLDAPARARLLLLSAALEKEQTDDLEDAALADTEEMRALALPARARLSQALALSAQALNGKTPDERAVLYAYCGVRAFCAAAQAGLESTLTRRLEFLLPEQSDILYRLSNLLYLNHEIPAEKLIGTALEIFPGRPCSAQHRHPLDEPVRQTVQEPRTRYALYVLNAYVTAYRRALQALDDSFGLSREISLLLSQQELSLLSLTAGSAHLNAPLRAQYVHCLTQELASADTCPALARAERQTGILLTKELRHAKISDEALPPAPEPCFEFKPAKGYLRDLILRSGRTLSRGEDIPVGELPDGAPLFRYQRRMLPDIDALPSHHVVSALIDKTGYDYRYEIAEHPIEALRDRTHDHTAVGRQP